MRSRIPAIAAIAAALVLATASIAFGRGGGHGGGFAGHGGGFSAHGGGFPGNPPGFTRGEKTGWRGFDTPPGWRNTKGKKKGWGTCVRGAPGCVPPGLR
jgi:hypothetical protein